MSHSRYAASSGHARAHLLISEDVGHLKQKMVKYVSDKEDEGLHNEGEEYDEMKLTEYVRLRPQNDIMWES